MHFLNLKFSCILRTCTQFIFHITQSAQTLDYITVWPESLAGDLFLADWRFWEQSANISPAKTLQCAVVIIRNHSFHMYTRPAAGRTSNRRHGVHHPQLHTTIPRLQGVLDTGGGRIVGLLAQSKRRVCGCCKDRRWCRCWPLTEEDRQPVLCFRVGLVRSSKTSLRPR